MVAPSPPLQLSPHARNPAYGALKIGAIGALVGLRFVLVRRSKGQETGGRAGARRGRAAGEPPHPVSKKKKRRKRRA